MNRELKYILDKLHNAGYEAYLVGGCVRDKIMEREVHDFDICTSALPTEVEDVFKEHKIIETGLKHGTVTIVLEKDTYEVTTFRTDGDYSDNRHPDTVTFVRNLKDDLLRRDFTMNAIVFDGKEYRDLFDGIKDIENQVIRCVGNPNDRFVEDALRILRAMRFSAQLGFNIEENTKKAMHTHKNLISNVSKERIVTELKKILTGENVYNVLHEFRDIIAVIIPEFEESFDFNQHNDWHVYDVYEHIIHSVQNIDNDTVLRLVMLFHDIGKPRMFQMDDEGVGHFYGHNEKSEEMTIEIMKRLKFDNDTIKNVSILVGSHDREISTSRKSVRKLISKFGFENSLNLLKVKCADKLAQNKEKVVATNELDKLLQVYFLIMDIMENGDCTDKKHLAITGNDLKDIGFKPSPLYSEIFKDLLAKVIDGELENNKEDLLSYVKNHYIFRVKTIIEFENGKRYEISKQGKDFDSLETKLIDEVQKICANNMQSGEKIRFKVEYRELDFIVDEEIKEYIYP